MTYANTSVPMLIRHVYIITGNGAALGHRKVGKGHESKGAVKKDGTNRVGCAFLRTSGALIKGRNEMWSRWSGTERDRALQEVLHTHARTESTHCLNSTH